MQVRATPRLRNRVRATREAKRLTQEALSALSGVNRTTISLLEQDDGYAPQGSVMLALAVALDVELGALWYSATEAA